MFQKLNVDINVGNFSHGNKITEYSYTVLNDKSVPLIQYHVALGECREKMLQLLPERFRSAFVINIMNIAGIVVPHTDSNIRCTINHYVQTNDEETIFFAFKENAEGFQITNQTNGRLFKLDEVNRVDSFIAKAGETWILDVTKPHGVKGQMPIKDYRVAIVMNTNTYSYQEVLEMLKETNSI